MDEQEPWPNPLRVWWVPQIPMTAFIVEVSSPSEAQLVYHALAAYDRFQLENNVKPDYANAGGVQEYLGELNGPEDDGWYDVDEEGVFLWLDHHSSRSD